MLILGLKGLTLYFEGQDQFFLRSSVIPQKFGGNNAVKGRVHGLAHAHESKCCFSPVYFVASMQAILFHNIVKQPIRSE